MVQCHILHGFKNRSVVSKNCFSSCCVLLVMRLPLSGFLAGGPEMQECLFLGEGDLHCRVGSDLESLKGVSRRCRVDLVFELDKSDVMPENDEI